MFGTLIESRPALPRRTGGSVASIIIHSFIITGGIVAMALDAGALMLLPEEKRVQRRWRLSEVTAAGQNT